jgi:hypothetical protein
MYNELTNLLPRSKAKMLRRDYFIRLTTVGVFLLVVLVIIHGILLIPSYLYAHQEVATESTALDRVSKSLATTQAQQVQSQLSTLQSEATYLTRLSSTPEASVTLRAILAVPHQGISLTGFSFTPASGGTPGTMTVSGIAATREELSSYDQALGALPFVSNANLPISDYAQESKIPFTITLTGSLQP